MKLFHRSLSVLTLFSLLFITNAPLVHAIPAPQDPSTESIITIAADGIAPFDVTSGPAVPGTDDTDTNGIVRNFDLIAYSVEVSLNDADDTNVQAIITLNSDASWEALAPECKTIAQGFNTISPDSNLQDNDGDGLNETMVCNLGDHTEGTKLLINPVAQAIGNNTDIIEAHVTSTSDNSVSDRGDGPVSTEITAGFGISLDKSVASLADEDETDYTPGYKSAGSIAVGSPEGKVIDWDINLRYNSGSEFVQDNGAGTQSFTIRDTWIGTHSVDSAIDSDNANGDYDDQIVMLGDVTGSAADNCTLLNATAGSVTCTQGNPGEAITIQITDVPTDQQPLAKVHLKMFVPYDDVFPDVATETYNIDNTAILTGWGGVGALVTSATGAVDSGPEVGAQDYLMSDTNPGNLAFYKTFDSIGPTKSGQRAGSRGEVIETSILIADNRPYDTSPAVCDTLDISSLEFVGSIGAGQQDAYRHGELITPVKGTYEGLHTQHNPMLQVYN